MRGKEPRPRSASASSGITPAYAGKSLNSLHAASFFWDHPRLCGEKTEAALRTLEAKGSPPPMRGKVNKVKSAVVSAGITPAYAGKSVPVDPRRPLSGDHPRLCGEKVKRSRAIMQPRGSPPPMRGKDCSLNFLKSIARITPAYAGKSSRFCFPMNPSWDHPRLCGEKGFWNRCKCSREGSPPPMRGKVWLSVSFGFTTRITPAYAGKRRNTNVLNSFL